MPDVRVRVFKDDFPDDAFIEKLKEGDRFIWIPDTYCRRTFGMGPVMYVMKKDRLHSDSVSCAIPTLAQYG